MEIQDICLITRQAQGEEGSNRDNVREKTENCWLELDREKTPKKKGHRNRKALRSMENKKGKVNTREVSEKVLGKKRGKAKDVERR